MTTATEVMESQTTDLNAAAASTVPPISLVEPAQYNIHGQLSSTNEIVQIVSDRSLDSNSQNVESKNVHLRNLIESDTNDDLLSNLDRGKVVSSREVEEATVDPLILLYRKIASKRRNNTDDTLIETGTNNKRNNRRNHNRDDNMNENNGSSSKNVLDDSESTTITEYELSANNPPKNHKENVMKTTSESSHSNDLYAENYDESTDLDQTDYDKLGFSVNVENESGNLKKITALEKAHGVSQELPDGYPTDRLIQGESEPNSR